MKRPKILEMDIVRSIAILAVVLIHTTADATMSLPKGSISQIIVFAVNEASQFAVPVFIFISGIVLFYRYYDSWDFKALAWSFYRKRIGSVLIPYLIWSFFYYIFYQWLHQGTVQQSAASEHRGCSL